MLAVASLEPHGANQEAVGRWRIETRVLEDIADLTRLADRWRDLLDRSACPQIVMTPSWALAWWREFGHADGRRLRAIVVEERGQLVGLALLSVRRVFHRR